MPDEKTIAFYDGAAARYADLNETASAGPLLLSFMALLPDGADVLDLGCGPARASAYLREAGHRPDPVDASQGMIDLANKTHDIGARLMTFSQVDMVDAYDGVWANFSLLHAPIGDLPTIFRALHIALRAGGVFHVAMKLGVGEERDKIDRLYSYVTVAELHGMLADAGFIVLETEDGHEVGCAGTDDPYVAVRARKNG